MQLDFACLFHEYPASALETLALLRRHYPQSLVHCGVDESAAPLEATIAEWGQALRERRRPFAKTIRSASFRDLQGCTLVPRRRRYSWRHLHRFLFDVLESMATRPVDFLANIDSDSLLTGPDLSTLLTGATWDFSVTCREDRYAGWVNGAAFMQQWPRYERIAIRLGLTPRPRQLGTMFALFILSGRACRALTETLAQLERDEDFLAFESDASGYPFYEALIPQLLGDLGLEPHLLRLPGYRYRPYWAPSECRQDLWFYHPVRRTPSDPCRRLLMSGAA